MGGAAFAGRGAAHHLGAIGDGLLGMEGALIAGEALADDLGVLVDKNGHYLEPFTALTTFCGRIGEIVGGGDGEARLGEDFLAQFDIGAFQPHHQRHLQRHFLGRGDDAFGDDVAFHDAAENVDQDSLHIGIADDDLEGGGDFFLGGAAAHIQEVGGLAAVKLDDVHGGHGQARAIHHAADLAVELDVGEIVFGGFHLHRDLPRPGRAAPGCPCGDKARCRRN